MANEKIAMKLIWRQAVSQILLGLILLWVNFGFFDKPESTLDIFLQGALTAVSVVCILSGFGLLGRKKWAYYACLISGIAVICASALVILPLLAALILGKIKGQGLVGFFIVLLPVVSFCAQAVSVIFFVRRKDIKQGLFLV